MKALLNFLILSLTLTSLVNSNVLGIDFGSNFISVGLLSTGRPITIIRNENEKRITPALVSIDGKERFVGTRAVSKASRRANLTSNNIIQLLGRSELPPNLATPYPLPRYEFDPERGTLYFAPTGEVDKIPVQDLAALILQSMQRLTNKTQNVQIRDVVITVPSYFAQSQRQAILDAAKIAGLNVLALIESNVAAAYQFGMERSRTMSQAFEEARNKNSTEEAENITSTLGEDSATRNVLFVDMGGSQLALSLVHYEFPRPNTTSTDRKHMTRKEKALEKQRLKKEQEEKQKQKAEEEEEEDEDDDDDEEDAADAVADDDRTDVMNETPEEAEQRRKDEAGMGGEEDEEEDDEDDPTRGTITISNQADLEAYMRKQDEWQKKKKAREEKKKQRYAIKTLKKSKSRRARMEERQAGFDQSRFIGKMEVLLTTTDESLGGRQIDALVTNYLFEQYHKAAAPSEYEQYGACRPFVYSSQADQDAVLFAEEKIAPEVKRHLRTPQNPRLFSLRQNTSFEEETRQAHKHQGSACQRLLNNPITITHFMRTAASAKEMLSVAPEWRGSLDDILPELPEFKIALTRKDFEDIAAPVFSHFRGVVQRFLREYNLMAERMRAEIAKDDDGKQSHLFDLASLAPLQSIVVQIMGGSMRIPALQDILLAEFQAEIDRQTAGSATPAEKVQLGRLLNVDEAAAFGSTMYAATLIPRYSVKGVMLVEHAPRRISMHIENTDGTPAAKAPSDPLRLPSHKSPLYEKGMFRDPDTIFVGDDVTDIDVIPVGTPLPCQKTLIIPRSCPFCLAFNYPTNDEPDVAWKDADAAAASQPANGPVRLPSLPLPEGVSPHLLAVNVSGSGASLAMFSSPADWATRVTVEVGKDGVFRVRKATLDVASESEKKAQTKEEKVLKDDEEAETDEDEDTKTASKPAASETASEGEAGSNATTADAEKNGGKKHYVKRRMALQIHAIHHNAAGATPGPSRYIPLSKKEVKAEQKRLTEFDDFEKEKEKLAELRNTIEAYVFEMKDRFSADHDDMLEVATEDQLDAAQEALEETAQWLDGEAADLVLPTSPVPESEIVDGKTPSPLEVLQKHLTTVRGFCDNIILRMKELDAFPQAASELRQLVKKLREKEDNAVAEDQMSEEEADEMERTLNDALDWLKEQDAACKKTPKGEAPPTTSEDVRKKIKEVEKAANDAIAAAERRVRQEKYEKVRKEREERKKKEKERMLKEKREREQAKLKKLSKTGYEDLYENDAEDDDDADGRSGRDDEDDEL